MLQLITDAPTAVDTAMQAMQALVGGCRWIQIRMKQACDDEVVEAARMIVPHTRRLGATLVVDDRVGLATAHRGLFDGVHVGKNDMPPAEARRMLGPGPVIGVTVNTLDDIMALAPWRGINYVGMGPYRFTTTKQRLAPAIGAGGYVAVLAEARRRGFDLPVIAVGGITVGDVRLLAPAGIAGVAVSGAVNGADDPVEATRRFMAEINAYMVKSTV